MRRVRAVGLAPSWARSSISDLRQFSSVANATGGEKVVVSHMVTRRSLPCRIFSAASVVKLFQADGTRSEDDKNDARTGLGCSGQCAI